MSKTESPAAQAEADPTPVEPHLPDRTEEARNLATEGLEEMKHGDKDEGKFLIEEARTLDKAAADAVMGKKT